MEHWWNEFLTKQGSRPRIGPWLYVVDNVFERLAYITGNGWPYSVQGTMGTLEEFKPLYEPLDRIIEHASRGTWEIFTLGNATPTR